MLSKERGFDGSDQVIMSPRLLGKRRSVIIANGICLGREGGGRGAYFDKNPRPQKTSKPVAKDEVSQQKRWLKYSEW